MFRVEIEKTSVSDYNIHLSQMKSFTSDVSMTSNLDEWFVDLIFQKWSNLYVLNGGKSRGKRICWMTMFNFLGLSRSLAFWRFSSLTLKKIMILTDFYRAWRLGLQETTRARRKRRRWQTQKVSKLDKSTIPCWFCCNVIILQGKKSRASSSDSSGDEKKGRGRNKSREKVFFHLE